MALPSIPLQFQVQSANGELLISWALTTAATSYILERSEDNITYSPLATISGSPLATSYVDTAVTIGVQYFYRVSAVSASGTSSPTIPQSATPVPTGEMTLAQIRLEAQQRADRVNSNFVTPSEWRGYINKASAELYDLLVTTYEDLYVAQPVQFTADGNTSLFPLPNGTLTFTDGLAPNQTIKAEPFYKLIGVDLAVNNAPNSYVSISKFNFSDRNKYSYPNTPSTMYGTLNLQYRLLGLNKIQMIPPPASGQSIRVWYVPRLKELLRDTDVSTIGISGWLEYVIVRAAKYALDKEESNTAHLDQEILFLKGRIEESASNRDAGLPDTISDTRGRNDGFGRGSSGGWSGGY